jgi:methyltransferase (TIGR00027 family)
MAKRPPAAQTAFGPMVITAVEQHTAAAQRLIHDDLAVRFLPPALRVTARAGRWGLVRNLLIGLTEKRAPGVWGGMLCRKRYADDRVTEALRAGIRQLVILGAGLDTRAYRLGAPTGIPSFEVDLPENIAYKRERLRAIYGAPPGSVALIPVDLQTNGLADSLAANGFRIEKPTMFVWEGVTQYLTEDAVRTTLAFLAKAATGSRLIFTYVRRDFLDGTNFYGAERIHRDFVDKYRVWHFGLAPDKVDGLLGEYGWAEREQVGRDELITRYVAPSGRDLSVSEVERFVYAERP